MAGRLCQVPGALVKSAIALSEAQGIIARSGQSQSEWLSLTPDEQIARSFSARKAITLALINGNLPAYIWSPADAFYRVPRDFWLIAGMTVQDIVGRGAFIEEYDNCERFLDAPPDLEGQPFLTCAEDVAGLAAMIDLHMEQVGKRFRDDAIYFSGQFSRSSTWDEISAWYQKRIAAAPGIGFTRGEDEQAGRDVGIGRDRVRELRRQYKPAHWSGGGRPSRKTRRN